MNLLQCTGEFEISENDKVKVTGRITVIENATLVDCITTAGEGSGQIEMRSEDVYKDLRLRGYEYEEMFRGIVTANADGEN